jgi:rhamnosyltransferase
MQPNISVVVRSRNEEKTISRTLSLLSRQTTPPREIILVDNESTDRTREIAAQFGCRIVTVRDGDFTHAYSTNLGASHCSMDLIVFTNGHSFPISETWLERGARHFADPMIAGVYGPQRADGRASFWEKIVDVSKDLRFGRARYRVLEGCSIFHGLGLLSTVSCIIRRDLWERHPFDDEVSAYGGGEDSEWGFYHLRQGYRIVEDRDLSVHHCHGDQLFPYARRSFDYHRTYFLAYSKNRAAPLRTEPELAKPTQFGIQNPEG